MRTPSVYMLLSYFYCFFCFCFFCCFLLFFFFITLSLCLIKRSGGCVEDNTLHYQFRGFVLGRTIEGAFRNHRQRISYCSESINGRGVCLTDKINPNQFLILIKINPHQLSVILQVNSSIQLQPPISSLIRVL